MQTKRNFLKTSAVLIGTGVLPYTAKAITLTQKFLLNTMPHYHEFNTAQNPSGYGWCGHTALKIAGQYVSGQNKTLNQIHTTFTLNSPGGYANNIQSGGYQWCASLFDLMMAAGLAKNGGYGRTGVNPWNVEMFSTNTAFFTKVKNAINSNYPIIIPSDWKYTNVGHFWVIVGYIDTGDVATSSIHLRDVAIATPRGQLADWSVKVADFLYVTPKKQILIMK
jgi:Peptidase_C39 like family